MVRLGRSDDDMHEVRIAAWCASSESYLELLHNATQRQGWRIQGAEDALPAQEWLARRRDDSEAQALAWTVGPDQPLLFGIMRPVRAETLIRQEILQVTPLDAQFGEHPRKSVPDSLREALFAEAPPSGAEQQHYGATIPRLRSYAVLDAAKVPLLPQLLETAGLPHRCLFKGAAAEALQSVAPYLVELREGNDFVRHLFTRSDRASDLWDLEPGLFIRSRGTPDEVWRHFRRFTRMRDEAGEWFYFRFWECGSARAYFQTLTARATQAVSWFALDQIPQIQALLIPSATEGNVLRLFAQPFDQLPPRRFNPIPTLGADDLRLLRAHRMAQDVRALSDLLARTFPQELAGMPEDERLNTTGKIVQRMVAHGFMQKDILFILLAWELFYGPGFEARDPEGILSRLMNDPRDEAERFEALKQRMAELG